MSEHLDIFSAELRKFKIPCADPFVVDDKLHRFKTDGDKEDNSWYALHQHNGILVGAFGCWKRNISETFCSKEPSLLSQDELHSFNVAQAALKKAKNIEDERKRSEAQKRAISIMSTGSPLTADHEYLKRKGVGVHGSAKISKDFAFTGWIALPLQDSEGVIHSVQHLAGNGVKQYLYGGRVDACYYPLSDDGRSILCICEGYATGASIREATGYSVVCAMTCYQLLNVAKSLRAKYPTRTILICADDDASNPDNPGITKATETAKKTKSTLVSPVFPDSVEEKVTDFNDLHALCGLAEVRSQILGALAVRADALTVRSLNSILSLKLDENDRILGDRLLSKGQTMSMLGAGGIGKSALSMQMAVCTVTGRPFISLETRCPELRWLFIQAENSNRRFQWDLKAIRNWVGESDWQKCSSQIQVHTLETELDYFLALEDPDTLTRVSQLIQEQEPHVIVWDSLYSFTDGDLNTDVDMRQALSTISRLSRDGNPERAIVPLHHAITGKSGAAKAVGFDRSSFGRNSKVLQAWSRGQINFAPGSPDNNDSLVVSCGKCSNGKEFAPFAILRSKDGIYNVDENFDLSEWKEEITGEKTKPKKITLEAVAECCNREMSLKELATAVKLQCICSPATAYRLINFAIAKKLILRSRLGDKFFPP